MEHKRDATVTTNRGEGSGESARTGPATGNPRGNDLPSESKTQKDGRRVEGGGGAPNVGAGVGRRDDRDLKERSDDAKASAGRNAPAKRGQPADTSEETAGLERHANEPE